MLTMNLATKLRQATKPMDVAKDAFSYVYGHVAAEGPVDATKTLVTQELEQDRSFAAQMAVLGTVLTLIIGAVALYVGILVLTEVENALPNETTNGSTFTSIADNVDSSFVLVGVGFIVLAAAFILGVLITNLGGLGGGGMR